MGFLNLFKKKEQKEDIQKELKIDQIDYWIKEQKEEQEQLKNMIFSSIKERIKAYEKNINEKINILKNIDLDSKKSDEKTKTIIKENINNYIFYLENFFKKLNSLKNEDINELFKEIDFIFLEFDKNTKIGYQKITILIGKEIAAIKKEIKDFSKEIMKLFNENKSKINFLEKIFIIESKTNQIKKINEAIFELINKIEDIHKKYEETSNKEKQIEEKIKEIENTEEYKNTIKKIKEIELKEIELKEKISKLRELINFKHLKNVYHSDKKRMEILKELKDNFFENFQKDNGNKIIEIIKENGLESPQISEKINQIKNLYGEISQNKKTINLSLVESLKIEKENLLLEMKNLLSEKEFEQKKEEKLENNKQEIIGFLKEDFKKMNIALK